MESKTTTNLQNDDLFDGLSDSLKEELEKRSKEKDVKNLILKSGDSKEEMECKINKDETGQECLYCGS